MEVRSADAKQVWKQKGVHASLEAKNDRLKLPQTAGNQR
jgi:hypothetical protein